MIQGKTIFITGGAGFIASTLIARLADRNKIVVYDNDTRDTLSGTPWATHKNLTRIRGDVLDFDKLKAGMRGAQIVVHAAAIAGIDSTLRNPVTTMRVNMIGTANALEAAQQVGGIERFLEFSTSEVFGSQAFKVGEDASTVTGAVGEARWTYAVSKLATEHWAFSYLRQFGLPACSVRPFNIYGPGQVGEGAIHRFIMQALKGEEITIHNDGSQIRAWCYVDDMVEGVMRALLIPDAVGHAFNIGNPRSVLTVYQLALEIVRLSKSASKIAFVPWGNTEVELRIPNIDKARRILGYEPAVDLEPGLLRTIEWYRQKLGA